MKYENARTYCAGVAEVEVNRQTGAIRCTRFYVAHDCGQIINPDGVRAQIVSNVIQTVSRTLKEELKWNRSRVTSVDGASYPILRVARGAVGRAGRGGGLLDDRDRVSLQEEDLSDEIQSRGIARLVRRRTQILADTGSH